MPRKLLQYKTLKMLFKRALSALYLLDERRNSSAQFAEKFRFYPIFSILYLAY